MQRERIENESRMEIAKNRRPGKMNSQIMNKLKGHTTKRLQEKLDKRLYSNRVSIK